MEAENDSPGNRPAREAILHLLASRAIGKTICPSEAARRLAAPGEDWRQHLDAVHREVDALLEAKAITLSWKGKCLISDAAPTG